LLDRIDLHLAMRNEPFKLTGQAERGEPDTATAAAQVAAARLRQQQRQQCLNAHLDLAGLQQQCALTEADGAWLEQAVERLGLSRRASHRVLKVARTLADLAGVSRIERAHLAEALQYRQLDRQPQGAA
tara:strand:- start:143 stop:529 length:387 start_codon:yes stop_codon:yes gene_type:complete